ncbi:MAG: polyprenyl synthetase family protein [Bacteroidetes bacterium]|nr:polyprenyl synthetase family protein [Bacteroidota bacterium]
MHHKYAAHIHYLRQKVEKELEEISFPERPGNLYNPLVYSLSAGGKRIRPLLVLLACELFARKNNLSLYPAIGIELFHNFTLIHDDIMDEADIRRNRKTVYKKWGRNSAILSGDVMLVRAYDYLCRCKKEVLPEVLKTFSDAAVRVCEGQQLDMEFEKKEEVSLREYLGMVSRKTGALVAASLKIGGLTGGATAGAAERLWETGNNLGIAFQLQDDYLDTFSTGMKFGKKIGGDIMSNKKTFLSVTAMELASGKEKQRMKNLYSGYYSSRAGRNKKIETITGIFREMEIDKRATEYINRYYNKCLSLLYKIPARSRSSETLRHFIDDLRKRKS